MIKFFRRIRQKLIHNGNLVRYFIYAIGEIILVVIGILIALSINNWNENLKNENQERVYYCKIKEDLESDKASINTSIQSLEEKITSAKRALSNLYQGSEDKLTILKDYFPAIRSIDVVPSKSAIQDITSSGKLENLKVSSLKEEILRYYTEIEYALININQNEVGSDQYIYAYEDLVDFGLHQINQYKDVFGEDLLDKMPEVNWHKDPSNTIYRQFQEHMTLSIVVAAREKQLLNQILISNEKLRSDLASYCD